MASEIEIKSAHRGDTSDPIRESVEREIERKLGSEIKNISPELLESLVTTTATVAIEYSGPIPPGFVLREYENTLPGAADRIIAMAENDQAHIHAMQKRELEQPHTYAKLGMLCGVSTCISAISASAFVTVNGYPGVGAAIFGTTLITIVGVFVKARLDNQQIDPKPSGAPPNKSKRRK